MALKVSSVMVGVILVSVIVIVFAIVAINPRDKTGKREPRLHIVADMLKGLWRNKGKALGFIVAAFAFMYALILLSNLLGFLASSKIGGQSTGTSSMLTEGWLRFFGAAVVIYALVAVFLTFVLIFPPSSDNSTGDDELARSRAQIYLTAIAIIFIVPVFALGVYPNLPQQVGGGQVLRVEAIVDSDAVRPYFSNSNIEVYLIDRTSSGLLFLFLDKTKPEQRVMEVSSDLIKSITFSLSP